MILGKIKTFYVDVPGNIFIGVKRRQTIVNEQTNRSSRRLLRTHIIFAFENLSGNVILALPCDITIFNYEWKKKIQREKSVVGLSFYLRIYINQHHT